VRRLTKGLYKCGPKFFFRDLDNANPSLINAPTNPKRCLTAVTGRAPEEHSLAQGYDSESNQWTWPVTVGTSPHVLRLERFCDSERNRSCF
jgi:hypothetical protein